MMATAGESPSERDSHGSAYALPLCSLLFHAMVWSTRYETDPGLRWDPERQVWTSDGFAFDGKETHDNAA